MEYKKLKLGHSLQTLRTKIPPWKRTPVPKVDEGSTSNQFVEQDRKIIEDDLKAAKHRYDELQSKCVKLEKDNDILVEDNHKLGKTIGELEMHIEFLNVEPVSLELPNVDGEEVTFDQILVKLNTARDMIELKQKAEQLWQKENELTSRVAELGEIKGEYMLRTKEVADARTRIRDVEKKNDKLPKDNEKLKEKVTDLKLQNEFLVAQKTQSPQKAFIDGEELPFNQVVVRLKSAQEMSQQFKNDIDQKTQQLEQKENELTDARSRIKDLEKEVEELKIQHQIQAEKIEDLDMTLFSIMIEPEVHAATQAECERLSKLREEEAEKKVSSLVKRVKNTKRKTAFHDEYEYGKGKKVSKQERGSEDDTEENPPANDNCLDTNSHFRFLDILDEQEPRNCGRELSPACLEKLIEKGRKQNKSEPVLQDKNNGILVTVEHIVDIFKCRIINENVINAYGQHLLTTSNPGKNIFISRADIWKLIVKEKHDCYPVYKQVLDSSVMQNGIVLFPMLSTGYNKQKDPSHWTLLVFDVSANKWKFYNTMMTYTKKIRDAFFEDAKAMKELIEIQVASIAGEHLKLKALPLEDVKDVPQQGPLNDCAILIRYFMRQIMRKRKIPKNLAPAELQTFKAEVIGRIVMNG